MALICMVIAMVVTLFRFKLVELYLTIVWAGPILVLARGFALLLVAMA